MLPAMTSSRPLTWVNLEVFRKIPEFRKYSSPCIHRRFEVPDRDPPLDRDLSAFFAWGAESLLSQPVFLR